MIDLFQFYINLHNICFKIDYRSHLNNFLDWKRSESVKIEVKTSPGQVNLGSDIINGVGGRNYIINELEEIRAIIYRK